MAHRHVAALIASLLASYLCSSASAQPAETIDKQITIYAAGTAGGGVDLFGRLLGRHLGRHIPGQPAVVVQDMPGAGGIRAANFMAEQAPRDGTALAIFPGGPILEPLIGARNPGYDMSQFTWIGAISKDTSVCFTWGATSFKSIEDAQRGEVVVAGTGAGSETDTHPVILNDVLKTKFKVVTGYLGTKETLLAIESGEAHGRCGMSLSSLKSTKPDWIRDKKINVLIQIGLEKSAEMPTIPLIFDLLSRDADKQLLALMVGPTGMARPFAAPPGVSPARATLLRRAFDAAMKDPAFRAEADQMQADLNPSTGEAVQALVQRIYATPADVIARAKGLLKGN